MKDHHSPVVPYLIVLVVGIGIGVAFILGFTDPQVVTTPAPPAEQTVLVVPDTKVVTKTERVEVPVSSPECDDYLAAADTLRTKTSEMSQNTGLINDLLSDMQVAIYNDDPVEIVGLKDRMHEVDAKNVGLWTEIGAATNEMKKKEGTCE